MTPPQHGIPPGEGFNIIQLLWGAILLPIGELYRRYFAVSKGVADNGKAIAVLQAHAEHNEKAMDRVGKVLDRIEEKQNR